MKLGLLLSGAVKALDIQSQFRAYIDIAYPSCQAVIAKCERPFIGYDIKERVFTKIEYRNDARVMIGKEFQPIKFESRMKTQSRKNATALSFLRRVAVQGVLGHYAIFLKTVFQNAITYAN